MIARKHLSCIIPLAIFHSLSIASRPVLIEQSDAFERSPQSDHKFSNISAHSWHATLLTIILCCPSNLLSLQQLQHASGHVPAAGRWPISCCCSPRVRPCCRAIASYSWVYSLMFSLTLCSYTFRTASLETPKSCGHMLLDELDSNQFEMLRNTVPHHQSVVRGVGKKWLRWITNEEMDYCWEWAWLTLSRRGH